MLEKYIVDKINVSDYFNYNEKEFIYNNIEIFSKIYQFANMELLKDYQKIIS